MWEVTAETVPNFRGIASIHEHTRFYTSAPRSSSFEEPLLQRPEAWGLGGGVPGSPVDRHAGRVGGSGHSEGGARASLLP